MSEPDWIDRELRAYAEQLVGGLIASGARRQEIQEELFSHLAGAYEEELARCGDQESAIHRAKRRLGRCELLSSEIQAAVPWIERAVFSLSQHWEVVMWKWLLAAGVAAVLIGLGFVFPAVAHWRMNGHLMAVQLGFLTLGVAITLGGVGSLGLGVKRLLAQTH
jgi:hypothetical protein